MSNYRYLFGPVPSRRLGRSLGIDLLPQKTCSFNCIFCQLGATPCTTLDRRVYAPPEDVLAELDRWIAEDGDADCITLAGSGEPTLHSRFGDVLRGVRERTPIRRVLLTNSGLLWNAGVRRDAKEADVVKVSLSAWDEPSFRAINRPANDLSFERLLQGIRQFSAEFDGELWVEVFAVPGVNASQPHMQKIAGLVAELHPAQVHLNTAVRPPAEENVIAVDHDELASWASLFTPKAEVAAASRASAMPTAMRQPVDLLALVERHPATAEQLQQVTGMALDEIRARLADGLESGKIVAETRGDQVYYCMRADDPH